MTTPTPLVTVRDLVKNYQALRPLRIQFLTLVPGDVLSITGLDAAAAEVLVGLLTGAMLPDNGDIKLFGRLTKDLTDGEAWLAMLDGVGIMTDRAVLVPQFSVEQNIAMPFTLAVDPIAASVRPRVMALADEVGIAAADMATPVAQARPELLARVRVARALALKPSLLLAEHPSASLPREHVKPFAFDMSRIAKTRTLALLVMTVDEVFATALGGQVLMHEAATGALRPRSTWHRLFKK